MSEENTDRIVVVGGGHAAAAFLAKIRALGHSGSLTLIAAESALPYQRPPLSKTYLKGDMTFEQLLLRPDDWYVTNNIELRLGQTVTTIDRQQRTLGLKSGETVSFDKLLLATGSTPRHLPEQIGGSLGGVLALRDLSDADKIARQVKTAGRLLVIGGGYIGLEAAASARTMGLDVTVVEMAERILQRVGSPETSDFFRNLHRSHGVDVRESTGIQELTGENGRVTGARLADGTHLQADFVVCGIGVAPNDGLAQACGIEVDNGILVNSHSRTSDENIYAAGDCARFEWRGQSIRLESVQNAKDQAETAANAMVGDAEHYDPIPWFWSDQYDVKLQIAGLGNGYTETITRPGKREGTQSVWYFKDDTLLSVESMNDPASYMLGRKLLMADKTVPRAAVSDPSVDLKQFA